jgi:hypothetical protein
MKTNMGNIDRSVRAIIALILGILAFTGGMTGSWAIAVYIVAIIFILTSVVGFCPLYSVFGFSTCPMAKS